jgi:energy-coupling factor transporter ATP-binding protein EcfA2
VPAGQTLAVTGPSGCGKSTLLQLLGGLDRPSDGEVWLGGQRIDHLGERALASDLRRRPGEAVMFLIAVTVATDTLTPPASWLLTTALVILTAVGALTALPTWAHTRHPAGRALDTEPV